MGASMSLLLLGARLTTILLCLLLYQSTHSPSVGSRTSLSCWAMVICSVYLQGRALTQLPSHRSQSLFVASHSRLFCCPYRFLGEPLGMYAQPSAFARQRSSSHSVQSTATDFLRKHRVHHRIARQRTILPTATATATATYRCVESVTFFSLRTWTGLLIPKRRT
jgi:hypothetical protein